MLSLSVSYIDELSQHNPDEFRSTAAIPKNSNKKTVATESDEKTKSLLEIEQQRLEVEKEVLQIKKEKHEMKKEIHGKKKEKIDWEIYVLKLKADKLKSSFNIENV